MKSNLQYQHHDLHTAPLDNLVSLTLSLSLYLSQMPTANLTYQTRTAAAAKSIAESCVWGVVLGNWADS
jgi:hypothetical protein